MATNSHSSSNVNSNSQSSAGSSSKSEASLTTGASTTNTGSDGLTSQTSTTTVETSLSSNSPDPSIFASQGTASRPVGAIAGGVVGGLVVIGGLILVSYWYRRHKRSTSPDIEETPDISPFAGDGGNSSRLAREKTDQLVMAASGPIIKERLPSPEPSSSSGATLPASSSALLLTERTGERGEPSELPPSESADASVPTETAQETTEREEALRAEIEELRVQMRQMAVAGTDLEPPPDYMSSLT